MNTKEIGHEHEKASFAQRTNRPLREWRKHRRDKAVAIMHLQSKTKPGEVVV